MLKTLVLATVALGLFYTVTPQKEAEFLSPIVPRTEAHERIDTWCEGEVNSLFCNPEYKWDARTMIAICMMENGYQYNKAWDPSMVFAGNSNGSVDKGICSINSIHGFDRERLFEPEYNVEMAYKVWTMQGYEAWSDYNNGRYKLAFQYLD